MDPETNTLHELTPDFLAKQSPERRKQIETEWAKFREGDIVNVRSQVDFSKPYSKFKIAEIGQNRLVLIPLGAT